ncbi:Ribose-phosphate pyrophosphokinase 1 [Phlyctochytrium planicorne]|nr:Ribose-phosphate pyrophosphokinase 1 [Phlyctochytrium planicorne]
MVTPPASPPGSAPGSPSSSPRIPSSVMTLSYDADASDSSSLPVPTDAMSSSPADSPAVKGMDDLTVVEDDLSISAMEDEKGEALGKEELVEEKQEEEEEEEKNGTTPHVTIGIYPAPPPSPPYVPNFPVLTQAIPKVKIFTGSSHPELSALILDRLGQNAAPAKTKRFANQEIGIELGLSVRNEDVYIIQSGSQSINDHIMELLIMVNACKLASARRITAVIPYFPYMKQSKKKKARGAITAKLLANMLNVAGVDHIITMDLHSSQIQGFFSKPVDNLHSEPAICQYIQLSMTNLHEDDLVGCIVCKNAGGAKRVTSIADNLKMDFALIHRERFQVGQKAKGTGNVSEADAEGIQTRLTLVGNVKGKVCYIVDDMIDGTHSFLDSAEHLKRCEAKRVVIIATHGLLSGDGLQEVEDCPAVDEIAVTNTYPMNQEQRESCKKLNIIDVSGVLAEAIRRTHNGESISYLFSHVV